MISVPLQHCNILPVILKLPHSYASVSFATLWWYRHHHMVSSSIYEEKLTNRAIKRLRRWSVEEFFSFQKQNHVYVLIIFSIFKIFLKTTHDNFFPKLTRLTTPIFLTWPNGPTTSTRLAWLSADQLCVPPHYHVTRSARTTWQIQIPFTLSFLCVFFL